MTCLFVCTGRNFISYKNDGSFFVPYLYFCFLSLVLKKQNKGQHVVLLVCMECFQGSLRRLQGVQPWLLPESECKGITLF